MLQQFCKSGGRTRPPKKDYLQPDDITLALNQYNARDDVSRQQPWAYFHETVHDLMPNCRPADIDWDSISLDIPDPIEDEEAEAYHDNLTRDLTKSWPSIAINGARRDKRYHIHYRLICFIHCHPDAAEPRNFYKRTYSMSVFDREVSGISPNLHSFPARAYASGDLWASTNACVGFLLTDG